MFTTYDRHNDRKCGNCATSYGGGSWYNNCFQCGLNVAGNNFVWAGLPGDDGRLVLEAGGGWIQAALGYHNGTMFRTYDRDNDQRSWGNCAVVSQDGGFWYNSWFNCRVNVAGNGFFWSGLRSACRPHSTRAIHSRVWLQCK